MKPRLLASGVLALAVAAAAVVAARPAGGAAGAGQWFRTFLANCPCDAEIRALAAVQENLRQLEDRKRTLDGEAERKRAELDQARKERDRLTAEWDRQIGGGVGSGTGTFASGNGREVRYNTQGEIETYVNGRPVEGSARPSPFMTRLKEQKEKAERHAETAQAELEKLEQASKDVDAQIAAAKKEVEAREQALKDCLDKCRQGQAASQPAPSGGGAGIGPGSGGSGSPEAPGTPAPAGAVAPPPAPTPSPQPATDPAPAAGQSAATPSAPATPAGAQPPEAPAPGDAGSAAPTEADVLDIDYASVARQVEQAMRTPQFGDDLGLGATGGISSRWERNQFRIGLRADLGYDYDLKGGLSFRPGFGLGRYASQSWYGGELKDTQGATSGASDPSDEYATLGGPIIRDRVWIWGSYGDRELAEDFDKWGLGTVENVDRAAMELYNAYRRYASPGVQSELDSIPTARDPWAILQSTPGVLTDRINVGGNERGQQSYYGIFGGPTDGVWGVDGIVITDMAAIGSLPGYYDFDSFEEMEVSTSRDARLAAGSVLRNLTKSGTDEWQGTGRYFLEDDYGDGINRIGAASSPSFGHFGDKIKIGRNAGPTLPPPTTWNQQGPTDVYKLEDTHVFSSSFFLTGMASYVGGGFQLVPPSGGLSGDSAAGGGAIPPGWQNSWQLYQTDRPQDQFKLDGNYFFNTGNASHELKFGASYRQAEVQSTSTWGGRPLERTDEILMGPDSAIGREYETIAPRVGLTYALGEDRKTLLRGSYSRFADQLASGLSGSTPGSYTYYYFLYPDSEPVDTIGGGMPLSWYAYGSGNLINPGLAGYSAGTTGSIPDTWNQLTRSTLNLNPTNYLSGLRQPPGLYSIQGGRATKVGTSGLATDDRYQLFIIVFIRYGPQTARDAPEAREPASWLARAAQSMRDVLATWLRLPAVAAASNLNATARFGTGLAMAQGQGRVDPAISLVATGASSGDAFQLRVPRDASGAASILAPDGLVLQAIRGAGAAAGAPAPAGVDVASVTGFCLEFLKPPPPKDMQYQVAPDALQQKYQPMRSVLEAGRALAEAGGFKPDSDPAAYATFIRQWALWTKLEGWDYDAFTREFIDRTRKNIENLGRQWTGEMEGALKNAAGNRFNDIMSVLLEADAMDRSALTAP